MAKNKLAKRNSLTSRKDTSLMKLGFEDHFSGCITEISKFKTVVEVI